MSDTPKHLHLLLGDEYPDLRARLPDGEEPEGDTYRDVWDAYLEANESTGAGLDGDDVRLDMEGVSLEEAQRALGIVIGLLSRAGYTLTVRSVERPYASGDDEEQPPEPMGDA